MICPERARLLHLYSQAATELSMLVSTLAAHVREYDGDAFDRAWEHCEEARYLCSQIQQQIYVHLREHRCGEEVRGISRV